MSFSALQQKMRDLMYAGEWREWDVADLAGATDDSVVGDNAAGPADDSVVCDRAAAANN